MTWSAAADLGVCSRRRTATTASPIWSTRSRHRWMIDRRRTIDRDRPNDRSQSPFTDLPVAQAPSSPTSRAAVGIGFQSPYPSHTHSETCGNSHTHRSPKSHSSPFSLLIFDLNLLSFHVCFVCFFIILGDLVDAVIRCVSGGG